ncbi:AsmA-like C-terminal region-containing protein, partial [Candidatus Pelagibacter sp.]|nr:AsmA-like C-terminal region-containing protein [Candidatus Pelagibacter sp.]
LDYTNKNKIRNKIFLKKDNKKYIIKGKSFDASKIINELLDNDDENISLFSNLNEEINININKTYINKDTFVNNLSGNVNFKVNKVNNLNLESFFQNQKKLTLSIKTNLNNEKITTLFTDYPKPLIQRYKFINGFEEGILDFYSIKIKGVSNSILTIDNFKVKEVPVFAKLLSLASLQGIADLLTGEGIRFTDFEMKFSNDKGLMTIEELYSIGPAVSILMDGYIDKKNLISLRGTLVPATTINRTIASIPLIGNILVGKKTGEGVFGVSFKIKGQSNNLKTTVNPVKTLTPRFITRTLEKIKKN